MNNEQEMRSAFDRWFTELGKIGDPLRRPGLVREAFESGAEWQRCQIKTKEAFAVLDLMDKETSLDFPSPEWSLEVPTESGFYWCRWPDDGPGKYQEPQVEELDIQDDIVYLCSMETNVERYPCALWWPIPISPPTGGRP